MPSSYSLFLYPSPRPLLFGHLNIWILVKIFFSLTTVVTFTCFSLTIGKYTFLSFTFYFTDSEFLKDRSPVFCYDFIFQLLPLVPSMVSWSFMHLVNSCELSSTDQCLFLWSLWEEKLEVCFFFFGQYCSIWYHTKNLLFFLQLFPKPPLSGSGCLSPI